ncbi:MAG TPA: hypothetical protein GXX77_08515, partial [Candidatus Cloacimonetes bacterium]|nr:hypothetical protein [Candidatus Cloacimonadota bacterium]
MKNTYIILTLALFCLGCLYAVEADEYLIGAYSQWRVDYENSDPAGAFSTLREKLYEGGFNAVNYTILGEDYFSNDGLGAVLSSLHNGGNESVRTILTDFSWKNEPTNNKIGAYSLFGNYLEMEAEYQLKYENGVFIPDVLPTNDNTEDDYYNTVFRHETGKLSIYHTGRYQNGYAWICNENDNHAAGMALSYPRFRWKPDNKNNPRTIGHDLKFRTRALAENKLYMTIALKVSGDEPNIPIADIKFKVLKYASADAGNREWGDYLESDYYEFPLISTNPAAYSTTIYNREYPFVDIDGHDNYLFEYYIDLPPYSTEPNSLYEQLMGGYEFFFHLNPQVYWRGNGCLEIDYLVLQDEFQRTIDATRATNVYWGRLQSRLNQIDALDTNSNILYHYLMDEPFQGQFRMYDNIQNYMAGQGKDVMTATHLENPWLKKPNGYDNYKHYKLFLKEANPKIIALDSYPLQETGSADSDLIKWNHEVNDPRFVQTRIQEITIDHYHELTKSINDDNSPFSETKLIYIPQIFGERMGTTSVTRRWKYFMPPLSMIKCLQMLPLCYAADGILSFTIASNPNSLHPTGRYYRVAPLQHSSQGLSTLTIDPQSSAFAYLTDANRKIAKYGPIIRKLLWRSADSIMNEGIHQSTILSEYKLNDLSVVQSDIGHYEGYVQCGFYLDNYSLPTFMLVNRRSVFRTTSSNEVVQMPVDDDFVNAPPQTVCFEPDDPSHGIFGTHIALYDPYDDKIYKSTSGVIDVKIDPGDGKLLQMCSSLPQVVTNDADLKEIAYLAGSITIDQGAEVTIHPGTTTNIFADSTILVKDGSTLNISGTVSIANNVSIIVENGSNIIFDNAICNWGINSILKVENSGITANNTILQSANAGETWQGLRINNAGTIGMVGTTITGAKSNEVTNSQVLLTNCKFNIPTAGTGLLIINSLPNQNVRITSTTDSMGFYSIGSKGIGLFLENPNANLFLNNTVFDGLSFGFVSYLSSDVEDTIQNCYFSNNGTGLILQDLQNSPLISNCTFYQNAIGAHFYAASPKVTECEFTGCDVGIRTELATVTTGGIYDSIFSQGETAIVSRGSNQRVSKNTF